MDNPTVIVALAIQAGGVIATLATLKSGLAGLRRRVQSLEALKEGLPQDYVPRREVELALSAIKDITIHIRSMMESFLAGRLDWRGSIHASQDYEPYDAISEQRLALVHPDLAARVHRAMDQLAKQGTYLRVAQGVRTYAEQDTLYAQGRTAAGHIVTKARGGYSNHNFGCAVDCFPFLSGQTGEINFNPHSPQFAAMVEALKAAGLAWGGDWHALPDAPHFQLANVPVTPADNDRAAFAEGGLPAVWKLYAPDIQASAETPHLVLRFIASSDFISSAIRLVTFSEWSHAELMTDTGTWIGAHADGGVAERPADYCAPARERRYAIPVTADQHARIVAFARSKIGTPYDFEDIAGLLVHHNLTERGRQICSMFVFEAALAGGLQMLNVLPGYSNLVTPETLHLSPYLIGRCIHSIPEAKPQ